MAKRYRMFVDGKWVPSSSQEYFDVLNPATETVLAQVPLGTKDDARGAIDAARRTADNGVWANKTPAERAQVLLKLADLVEKNVDRLARLESLNVGKTIKWSRDSDFPFIIDNLRFFAGAARMLEGKAAAEYSGMGTSVIRREPVGVVASVVPWNYPLYIAVWKIAPALAAGNTLVIKPASYTPLTLLEFGKLAEKAGVPKGVLNIVTGSGDVVGTELASNAKVDMISLTGDTATGKKIMQLASSSVKRVHLELGGKAPCVILPDADIDAATEGAVIGAFWNTGQDCTAVTRVYAPKSMYRKVAQLLVKKAKTFRLGNPLDRNTDMGPLISERQRKHVEDYVHIGLSEGAKVLCGGKRPKHLKKGYYFEPTVLGNVEQDARVCREEIFGPVLAVAQYSDVDDVVEKANDVVYGLAASVWGKDITKLLQVAHRLKFGTVWINEHGVLTSEMPHGGYKQSGFGKDLSLYSFEEYTQIKHIYIDQTGLVRKPWHYTVYGKP